MANLLDELADWSDSFTPNLKRGLKRCSHQRSYGGVRNFDSLELEQLRIVDHCRARSVDHGCRILAPTPRAQFPKTAGTLNQSGLTHQMYFRLNGHV